MAVMPVRSPASVQRRPNQAGNDTDDLIRAFVEENSLDAAAERALRELPEDQLRQVLEEGPCSGTNKSAVLISRIRRSTGYVPGASGAAMREFVQQDQATTLQNFIAENELDAAAVKALMEVPEDIQTKVISEGLVTGRNKSAILIGRVKRALSGGTVQVPQPGVPGVPSFGVARPSPVGTASPALDLFILENGLDEYAEKTLRDQNPQVQATVIAEGQVTGDNKSKILMGRVRRAQQNTPKGPTGVGLLQACGTPGPPPPPRGLPPPGTEAAALAAAGVAQYSNPFGGLQAFGGSAGNLQPVPFAPGQPPPPMMPFGAGQGTSDVEDFITVNSLDSSAAKTLRDQRIDVQTKVISEGFLTGANKSAVLMSRVRRVVDQLAREQVASTPVFAADPNRFAKDPVSTFIRDNNLDAGAGQALRDQPQSVQQRVLDEGPITGTNRSAVVISRIRRIQQNPF